MLNVKVNGEWLAGIRLTEELSPTTRWPGGSFELTFTMATEFGWRSSVLSVGAKVEVYDCGFMVWAGVLDQPDWSSGSFTARGLSTLADGYPAFDLDLNATSNPRTAAITAALSFGWPITIDDSVPNEALVTGDTTDGINMTAALLDAAADEQGQRWAVRPDGALYFAADAVDVDWHLAPGIVELGQSNANYRSDIFVRYLRDTDNALLTQRAQWSDNGYTRTRYGFVGETVDVTTNLGPISTARAAAIGNGILTNCAPRPGWTNAVEVQHGEILTAGGEPAPLSLIAAGQVVRLHGVYDDASYLGVTPYLDVVLGEVKYVDGEQTISLAPVDASRDDLASVIEDLGNNAA